MEKNPYNPITEEQVLKHAHSSMFNDGYRSNFVFIDIRAIQSLLDEHKSAELSELQEKYNKLRSAFENLLNRSIDHIEINPLTEKSKFELRQRLLSEAGLKEQ